ncbi:MAG: polyprenyl synthetase family protein [Treponema sp.]|jgi:octaprenyl-diphosphate synthase|nr:polyprenyl synthetase family protein [Treponema sp.]
MQNEYIERIAKIDAVLNRYLPENPGEEWLAEFFPGLEGKVSSALLSSLSLPAWDLVNRGGKRWRPLLMVLVCESLGGADTGLALTPLVEFPHNASLIHDDIEDNSDERRGKPAVHILYGVDASINSGCFLYFLPLLALGSWEEQLVKELNVPADVIIERKNLVYSAWGDYLRRLHLGQAMDIAWHRDFASLPGLPEYYTMCGMKTGCLARLAAVLGVITAFSVRNVPPKEEAAIRESIGTAAENLGVGFQILDDVKNLETGVAGKKRGDDIVEGKKSLPVLLYLHRKPDKRELVSRCFRAARNGGTGVPEVEALIGELGAEGCLGEAKEKGLVLIKEAEDQFAGVLNLPLFNSGMDTGRRLLLGLTNLIS